MTTYPTRFSPPAIAEKSVVRYALIRQLENLSKKNILYIHAPAGYGKTTAASQWLSETGRSAAWITLDEYYASPSDIYKGILRILSCQIDEKYTFTQLSLETMLAILSSHTVWPQALVIDDFHLCTDTGVIEALSMIRLRIPSDMAFVVISRNPPHDVLSGLIIKGSVKQITNLQFEEKEIADLFQKNKFSITKQHAKLLKERTDGWAAALSAILMAKDYEPYCGLLDQHTLNHYLKSHVFDFYDDFHILKKCSISDILYPKLCEAISGQAGAWEVINALAQKTGLVTRLSGSVYRFHALLREFLSAELESDANIDKTTLYDNAANWFIKNGDRFRALNMMAKTNDLSAMEKMTREIWGEYGSDSMDIAAYVNYIEEYLLTIPRHISEQYPRISLQCFHGALNCRPVAEVLSWFDVLERHMNEGRYHQADYVSAAFMIALEPRQSSWYVPKQFERVGKLMSVSGNQNPRVFSLSQNLPFFHKAQRDYTDIATELPAFIEESRKQAKSFLGPAFDPLAQLIEAGVYYEMGELKRAEQLSEEVVRTSTHFPSEIRFCAFALYFEVLRLLGKQINLIIIGNMIADTKANYLAANFNSYEIDTQLYEGDKSAADIWLNKHIADEDIIRLYKFPQYFTTARAFIVLNRFSDALKLLSRIVEYSKNYRRSSDYIEALTLQALCHWHMAHHDKAVSTMEAVINKSSELKIVMPAAKYGANVIPIMQKIQNRLKHGYGEDILDKAFVNTLFIAAKTVSQNVRGMLLKGVLKKVTLSPRQKEMLDYLSQNLTYQEIGDKTGIKITTVRDHITKLYEKLEVSTAADAVMKGKALSL